MRQEMGDNEGEVVEREAGRAAQGAHHGALLLARPPGQFMRLAGTVLTRRRPTLAPLADRLSADAKALGQLTSALDRVGDLGPHSRGGAGIGMNGQHQAIPPAWRARSRPSKRQAYVS